MATKSHRRTAATKGFSPEQIAALTATKHSQGSRTPRAVVDAIFPTTITVGDLKLRSLSLGEFILMEKIESPLLEVEQMEDGEITLEQFAAAVFILATPFAEVEALICDRGRVDFDRAVRHFATKCPGAEVIALGRKVKTTIAEAFATVVQTSGGEKKTIPGSAGG